MRPLLSLCIVFALSGCLPAGKPLVRVEFPSASPAQSLAQSPTQSPAPPAGLSQFSLSGQVQTAKGPAAGARIAIDNTPFVTQADQRGAFRLNNLPADQARSLSISSTAPDGTRYSLRMPLMPTGPQIDLAQLLLSESGSVYGKVSAEGLSDLTGVLVFLAGTPQGAFCNTEGEYFLSGLAPGSYTLTAFKEGYAPVTGNIRIESGKPSPLDLKLTAKSSSAPQTASLAGQVQSAKGPLAGVTVHLAGESFLSLTDSQGQFKLSNLPAGNYTLMAQREGYLPQSQALSLQAGEKVQKVFTLQAQQEALTGRVRGVAQDSSGQALPETDIETVPPTHRVKTDPQGRFDLPELMPGSYYLRAVKQGKTHASRFVAVEAGQTAETLLRGSVLNSPLCDQQNNNQVTVHAPGAQVNVTINNSNECLLSSH